MQKSAYRMASLYFLLTFAGRSAVMALSEKKESNLAALHVGSTQEEVEVQLDNPIASTPTNYGARADFYEYGAGSAPSVARAIVRLIYDVLTLGIYEIFGTVTEASLDEKPRLPIYYGPDDRVAGVALHEPDECGARRAAESVSRRLTAAATGALLF